MGPAFVRGFAMRERSDYSNFVRYLGGIWKEPAENLARIRIDPA